MAEASDSDGSCVTGWALVDKEGDIEHSDSASTGSGSDFVNLEPEVVSYHHKEKQPTNLLDCTESPGLPNSVATDQQDELVESTQKEAHSVSVDSTVDQIDSESEDQGLKASAVEHSYQIDDTGLPQDDLMADSSSSIEELCIPAPEDHFLTANPMELDEHEGDFVEPDCPEDDDTENENENDITDARIEKLDEPGVNDAEESDHSDFVKLDASMADEAAAGPSSGVRRAPVLMHVSTSSTGSSISPNFQFVHPMPIGRQFQPHYDYEDDDDSIPSDVDDRCESDISGVAADDTDLSAMSYSIGDLPLVSGPKSYKHWPNSTLNATLTVLALLALFTAIGIGVGHYFGSVRDVNLRQQQIYQMKAIQDDYLKCLQQQTSLEKRLKQPTVSDNKLAAVAAIWKDKYEELIVEKADLEEKLAELQTQVTDQLGIASQQIKEATEAAGKLSNDLGNLDPDVVEIHKLEYDRLHLQHKQLTETLKAKEYEFVKFNETTILKLKAKQRYLDTLRRHLDGIASNNLEKSTQIESMSRKLADSLIKTERMEKDYALAKQESLVLEENLKNLKEKHKSDAEELIQQWETEVKNKEQLTGELQVLKVKLNQLEVDNNELKRTISRLRYTEHPGNEVENKEVKVHELKDKVNELANENVDLKTMVVKIRYTAPIEDSDENNLDDKKTKSDLLKQKVEEIPSPPLDLPSGSSGQTAQSAKEMERIKESLFKVNQQLQTEKSRSLLLQAMYVAEKEKADKQAEFTPSIFTCFSLLFPTVNLSDTFPFQPHFMNASKHVYEHWAFFNNLSADANFTTKIVEKWRSLVDFASHPFKSNEQTSDHKEIYVEAKEVLKDIQNSINQKWMDFQHLVKSSAFLNKSADKIVGAANKIHEKVKHFSAESRFDDYMNKTKESVSKLSQKIEDTWHKVKNLSEDFLKIKTVKNVAQNVESGFRKIKEKVHKSLSKVSSHLHWRKYGKKHQKHHNDNKYHMNQRRKRDQEKDVKGGSGCKSNCGPDNKFDETQYSGGRAPFDDKFINEDRRLFENKPFHKQKQSSNHVEDAYHEFWKQAHFDPDDIIHEGFFEGNKREWRKHQKTLHKLHSRVEKLNEDIFLDMDEDDIEDMYDDLEDFEDDIDDKKDQPQGLKTWLSCQLRWWKGRIQRKKQNEKLVTECGRQIMNWQLKATCSPSCLGRKCKKQSKKLAKVCKTVMDTQEHNQAKSESSNYHYKSNKPARPYQSIKVTGDEIKRGTVSTSHGNLKYTVSPLDIKLDNIVTDPINETAWDFDHQDQSNWYFRRVQSREDAHTDPPVWLFRRMDDREDKRHSPEWLFERAEEREFERGKPWYLKRADYRQGHLQTVVESDEELRMGCDEP